MEEQYSMSDEEYRVREALTNYHACSIEKAYRENPDIETRLIDFSRESYKESLENAVRAGQLRKEEVSPLLKANIGYMDNAGRDFLDLMNYLLHIQWVGGKKFYEDVYHHWQLTMEKEKVQVFAMACDNVLDHTQRCENIVSNLQRKEAGLEGVVSLDNIRAAIREELPTSADYLAEHKKFFKDNETLSSLLGNQDIFPEGEIFRDEVNVIFDDYFIPYIIRDIYGEADS